MRYRIIIGAALLALLAGACESALLDPDPLPPAPAVHASRFATVLDSLRYALDLPALAGAIVTDDSILQAAAVGSRRYGGPENVTDADQFHLGSCTKAITGTLMGVLVDEGRLGWTATLPELFPELAATMRPEYRNVTLVELLSHSSGLPRDPDVTLGGATPREQRARVVAWAVAQPPTGPRGAFSYSNLGYILAGAAAERLENTPFEDLMEAKVLRPLGITSAGWGPMGTPGLEDQPLQHTNNHAVVEPTADADVAPVYSPSGRLHMSIGDWAKFARWRLAAEAGHQTLLRDETARTLTEPVVSAGAGVYYALGWNVMDLTWTDGRSLQHNGSNILNYSAMVLAVRPRWGILLVTNQGPGAPENPVGPAFSRLLQFASSGRQEAP